MTNAFASLPLYPFLIYWNASLFRIFRERASLSIPVPFPRFRPRDCCGKAEQSVMICGDIQPLISVELEKWLLKANTGLKDIPSSVSNITDEDMVLLNTGFQHILMLRVGIMLFNKPLSESILIFKYNLITDLYILPKHQK
ncbi:8317_t:CDS:2 [Funneliformis mosseae]|uniref:8317_t:CDS:1 n=1 Tax=Funneliformis mosseae TaxID=27381 RepID=A0A9N9B7F9_FUNMO|nr:8317_t:CDS:2 [Funneliformis mosseae]